MDQFLYYFDTFGFLILAIFLLAREVFRYKKTNNFKHSSTEIIQFNSENIKREEKLVLVYPLAKSRFLKEALIVSLIISIIWCVVVFPAVTIIWSEEKITSSDLELIFLIGSVILACSLLFAWWIYIAFKGYRLSLNSETYCIGLSEDELSVGMALLDNKSSVKFIKKNQLSLKISWTQLKNVEVLDGSTGEDGVSSRIILTIEDLTNQSEIKSYFIYRWYLGAREKELLGAMQAHLSYPIQGYSLS